MRILGDTGWVQIGFASGWRGSAAVRRIGRVVYVSGYIQSTSGNVPAGLTTAVASIQDGFRPTGNTEMGTIGRVSNAVDTVARFAVSAGGTVDLAVAAACNHVRLDGLSWPA